MQKSKKIYQNEHLSTNQSITQKIKPYGYKIINYFEVSESFFDDGLVLTCTESIYNNLHLSNFTISKKR